MSSPFENFSIITMLKDMSISLSMLAIGVNPDFPFRYIAVRNSSSLCCLKGTRFFTSPITQTLIICSKV